MSLATHRFPARGRRHPAHDLRACPQAKGSLVPSVFYAGKDFLPATANTEFSKNLLSRNKAGTSGGDRASLARFRPEGKEEDGDSPVASPQGDGPLAVFLWPTLPADTPV